MFPQTMPWYRSSVIWGAIISVISKVLVLTGVTGEVSGEDQEQLVNLIVLVLGGLGDLWALRARIIQEAAPTITLTKK